MNVKGYMTTLCARHNEPECNQVAILCVLRTSCIPFAPEKYNSIMREYSSARVIRWWFCSQSPIYTYHVSTLTSRKPRNMWWNYYQDVFCFHTAPRWITCSKGELFTRLFDELGNTANRSGQHSYPIKSITPYLTLIVIARSKKRCHFWKTLSKTKQKHLIQLTFSLPKQWKIKMNSPCRLLSTVKMYAMTSVSLLTYRKPKIHVSPSRMTSTTAPLIHALYHTQK